jgi:hypothetical protein
MGEDWHRVNAFEDELRHLINKHCIDTLADTPDHLLAHYFRMCLEHHIYLTRAVKEWRQ